MNIKQLYTLLFAISLGLFFLNGCARSIEEKQVVETDKNITIKLEGQVYPSSNHKILSPFAGKIKQIFVKDGQKVHKGEKLYSFETKDLHLQIKTLTYEIAMLKKQLQRDQHNTYNNTAFDDSVVKNAERYLKKTTKLYANGYATESELIRAKKEYFNAKREYANIRYTVQSTQDTKNVEKQRDLVLLQQKQNELTSVQDKINNAYIVSPIDGYFIGSDYKAGNFVETSAQLGSVINIDKVIVKAGLAPGLYKFIKEGNPAKVNFFVTPPYSVEANISRVIPIVDPKIGQMIVEIAINNKNYLLQNGMKAMVKITLDQKDQDEVKKYFIERENQHVVEVSTQL